ncbi:sensor histidine kinase [Leptospira sp. 'Mane']|uniref:sensor histidine kinase n=1 Tax=Leptospira sp. 'Mane' TaxID=3387407 RepID=UPI00398B7786
MINTLSSEIALYLETILASLPYGNYAILDEDLRFLLACGKDYSARNYQPDMFVGKLISEIPQSYRDHWENHFKNALNGIVFQDEYKVDDETYFVKIAPIRFPKSDQVFILFSGLNITKYKGIEKQMFDVLEKQGTLIEYEENLHKEIIKIFNWRQEIGGKGGNKMWMEQALPNLNTSLMQGSGLGALVTSIGAMLRKAKKEEKTATVPLTHLEMVEENFKSTKKLVETLAKAQLVFEETRTGQEKKSLKDIMDFFSEEQKHLEPMLAIKKQDLVVSTLKNADSSSILINEHALRSVIREVLINAMKYSPEKATLVVLFMRSEKHFIIKVMNPPAYPAIQNLDYKKSEEVVLFQPFYRLSRAVDERYDAEEFGLGLGLAIVKKVVEDMNARVYFNVIQSNIYSNVGSEVCVSLEFPVCLEVN